MTATPEPTPSLHEVEQEFVALWRRMSGLWGINPTMGALHGLLFISGQALSAEDLMERLGISRGNVSMNLARLSEWGLVRRIHQRGDRREYYESVGDVWEMCTLVAAQRKRLEIDPVLTTLRECRERLAPATLGPLSDLPEVRDRRRRIDDLLTLLSLVDTLAQRFFESHKSLRTAVELLAQEDEPEPRGTDST